MFKIKGRIFIMNEAVEKWEKKWGWLGLILLVVLLLRIPSLFEPYWYGDEGIYLTLGQAVRGGVRLYKEIHDNKPPFLYLIAAIAGGNQFWFKFITTGWSLATVSFFAKLANKVWEGRQKRVMVATGIFALLTTLPWWEGNIANAELYFLLPTLVAAYWLWDKNPTSKAVWWSGVMLGLGGLFKMPALLEAGVWPLVWLAEKNKKWWKRSLILGLGIAMPLVISLGYYLLKGSLNEYWVAAWRQNLPYLSSWQAGGGGGVYSIKGRAIVAALLITPILGLASVWGRRTTIVGVWGVITLFAALLSGRPYPHYLLQMAGAAALGVSLILTKKTRGKVVLAGVGLVAALSWVGFKFYNYQVASYYFNYVKWLAGVQNKQEYFAWFNPQVNTNYEIAKVVKSGSTVRQKVFVWGDEPMVYALSGRLPATKYIVKYHIKDFGGQEETLIKLRQDPPKYIVSFGGDEELPGLSELINDRYILEQAVGTAKIYRQRGIIDAWMTDGGEQQIQNF